MLSLDVASIKDRIAFLDRKLYRRIFRQKHLDQHKYRQDILSAAWTPVQAEILSSSILLFQKTCADSGCNEWATSWHIPRRGSRSSCSLASPHSRCKFFDYIWPHNIVRCFNVIDDLDPNCLVSRKLLLKNKKFIKLILKYL